DTIVLPAGTYTLTIAGTGEDAAATGDLDITGLGGALTISGAGAATTIIDGGALDTVFETIFAGGVGANATISDVTIRNGNGVGGKGGGINVNTGTTLTLNRVVVTACKALGAAAGASGVDNSGTLHMNTVVVANNDGPGGGINNGLAGVLDWTIGEVSGNTTGGGIQNKGSITLTNVTVSGNSAPQATGIDNSGTATLQNVTISSNTAAGLVTIGGIRNVGGTVSVRNTIISGNTPLNCSGLVAASSLGNNLENANSCGFAAAGDLPNTDPLLAALALNGAPLVKTRALPAGSPAIDKGSATVFPATDARGVARPVDGNIPLDGVLTSDIGAYEFRPQKITVTPPSPSPFGTVTTGTTKDQPITLTNTGDGALVIGSLAVTDPLAAPFSLLPAPVDACSGKTLALAGTCTFTVRFASPVSIVPATDTFNIPSNDPATPAVSFAVSGTGTVAPVPQIAVTDSIAPATDQKVLFGSVTTGSLSDATITITNPGTANLVIGTIAGTDTLAAPFSILNDTCSAKTVAPLANCTLTARFAPAAAGIFDDTFNIPSNDPATPTVSFALSGLGTALPVPLISVTDSKAPTTDQQVPFGSVLVGGSTDATITATNNGTANLVIGQIASANPLAAPFSILNDTCSGKTIAPAAACTLTVHFAPTAGAPASDTFDIPSNVTATPAVTITVSGTGTVPLAPAISVTDSIAPATDQQVPFGVVLVGGSADATITATNTGTSELVMGQIASANPLAAPFSILNDNCSGRTLAPASACTLTVRFAPTATGPASDTFDILGISLQPVTVSVSGGTSTTATGTINSPPANPVLVSPTNGQAGVPAQMTFTWKKSVDPDGDVVTYRFIYGTDPNFTGSQTVNVASSKSAGLLFAGLGSVSGGILMFGLVSGSGMKNSRKLFLVIPVLLLSGALFTACGGGGDTSVSTTTTTTLPPTDVVSTTVTGLTANTTYYWKVVADDGKGGQAASETFSFNTK
ncbi:MAG TPA: choice-of-anchor D domain-containing protein, partial [Dongiaceae bacterium]|nr:choice-of-anchor D domain-containing protein [Dongiaceae bacterium]